MLTNVFYAMQRQISHIDFDDHHILCERWRNKKAAWLTAVILLGVAATLAATKLLSETLLKAPIHLSSLNCRHTENLR